MRNVFWPEGPLSSVLPNDRKKHTEKERDRESEFCIRLEKYTKDIGSEITKSIALPLTNRNGLFNLFPIRFIDDIIWKSFSFPHFGFSASF